MCQNNTQNELRKRKKNKLLPQDHGGRNNQGGDYE